MSTQANFTLRGRNPDVLTCIANLSNDEVFTPPEFASQMLDTLAKAWAANHRGADLWADKTVKFLDPCTKSGVFLREITSRLTTGLENEIPDLEKRVNHILTKQVFGIGITQITGLLARRSLYCSKHAKGAHSIAKGFASDDGNIWFKRIKHTWDGDKCKYCGAGRRDYDRDAELETHAYGFIHTDNIKNRLAEIFGGNMQFDVIIGNPPYQLNDGGGSGTSAGPIYNRFVEQALALSPKFLSMVIPARWFSGGKGLDDFRDTMLKDNRIRIIHDFPDASHVFPGVQIKGGVCFFLWERDSPGDCDFTSYGKSGSVSFASRPLLEEGTDVLIRYNEAIPILEKVMSVEGTHSPHRFVVPESKRFDSLVSTRRPFGDVEKFLKEDPRSGVKVYRVGGTSYAKRYEVPDELALLDAWKVFIPFLASGSDSFPHPILGRPFIGEPGSATTETNLAIGPFGSETEAKNVVSYISTRFFRFLVLQRKPSQNATRKVYGFVPTQDFSKSWSDADLYKKYGITKNEIAFIESMIRPMGEGDE